MALLDVILGYDCNVACDYCTISPDMRGRALSSPQVVKAMRTAREKGTQAISFSGGEPTLRADLVSLVALARASGFTDIKLQTNGLLLAHPPNVDRLLGAGVNRFHVSIHTHQEAAFDALVRREGSYPAMVRALDNLVERKVRLTADLILKEDTYRKLPDAIRWLHGRGVRSAHLWFVSLTDAHQGNVASMPTMTAVLPAMREAFAFARAHEMDVRSLHLPRCLLGPDADRAYDPGADGVTVVTPDATFSLEQSKLAGHLYVAACEGCRFRPPCPGARADYLAHYGGGELGDREA